MLPERLRDLAPEAIPVGEIPALLVALAALQSALAARLIAEPAEAPPTSDTDPLLDVKEAAKKLGVSVGWVYHRKDLPFRVSVGGKVLFSSTGIAKYLRARQAR